MNPLDDQGNTPLHLATDSNNQECAEILLLRGADSTITNQKGMAPIHIIAEKDLVDMLKVCMAYRIKPEELYILSFEKFSEGFN